MTQVYELHFGVPEGQWREFGNVERKAARGTVYTKFIEKLGELDTAAALDPSRVELVVEKFSLGPSGEFILPSLLVWASDGKSVVDAAYIDGHRLKAHQRVDDPPVWAALGVEDREYRVIRGALERPEATDMGKTLAQAHKDAMTALKGSELSVRERAREQALLMTRRMANDWIGGSVSRDVDSPSSEWWEERGLTDVYHSDLADAMTLEGKIAFPKWVEGRLKKCEEIYQRSADNASFWDVRERFHGWNGARKARKGRRGAAAGVPVPPLPWKWIIAGSVAAAVLLIGGIALWRRSRSALASV